MPPRPISIVGFSDRYRDLIINRKGSDCTEDERAFFSIKAFWYLGRISNMPGHCLVSDVNTGQLYFNSIDAFSDSIDSLPPGIQSRIKRELSINAEIEVSRNETIFSKIRSFFKRSKAEIGCKHGD